MANIRDVAEQAKVSTMTVSRVINNASGVKASTRKKVLEAMEELNYVPNQLVNGLYKGKTKMISVIIPNILNPFFTTIVRAVEDHAHKNGYRVILCNSDEDVQKEYEYIEMSYSVRVDGMIIVPTGDDSKNNLENLKKFGVPFILVDASVKGIDADLIVGDNFNGSRQLVQHLIEMGHKNIGMIIAKDSSSVWRDRHEGYKAALKQAGLEYKSELVKTNTRNNPLDEIISSLLTRKPTAIVAGSSITASRVVNLLVKNKKKIPDDISIVCFENVDFTSAYEDFLTVAVQPAYRYGMIAFQILLKRMSGDHDDNFQKHIISPEIIIRSSVKKL